MGRFLLCLIAFASAQAQVTYSKEISRIFQAKCQQCHRVGDIAPFPLDTYETAVDFKDDIKRVITEGIMPPWKPAAGYGEFQNNFSLSDAEKSMLVQWVDAGTPFGNESELPESVAVRGDWVLGEPDLVLQMPEAYTPPRGKDMYRCFVLPTESDAARYVSAADVLPGDRRYVHHVILYLDTTGEAEKLDEKDPGPGYTCFGGPGTTQTTNLVNVLLNGGLALGGWAPGTRPQFLPEGIGAVLPAKARVVMQVHYYPRGGTASDQTKVGLYFTKGKVNKRLLYLPILPLDSRGNIALEIPAGNDKYAVTAEFAVPPFFDAHVVNIFPHMHLLGTDIKSLLIDRNGKETPLIWVPNWDFNWQGPYAFVDPPAAPALSRVKVTCTYNNSESNPRNPNNPVKTVRWGEGTEDEMCVVFMGITLDRDQL